jgi:hypothetical protein
MIVEAETFSTFKQKIKLVKEFQDKGFSTSVNGDVVVGIKK